jgi:hypothetical protein
MNFQNFHTINKFRFYKKIQSDVKSNRGTPLKCTSMFDVFQNKAHVSCKCNNQELQKKSIINAKIFAEMITTKIDKELSSAENGWEIYRCVSGTYSNLRHSVSQPISTCCCCFLFFLVF